MIIHYALTNSEVKTILLYKLIIILLEKLFYMKINNKYNLIMNIALCTTMLI